MRYALNRRQVRHDVMASGTTGFTLIEVLVTVVCLAVAAVIVLPAVSDNSGERLRGVLR